MGSSSPPWRQHAPFHHPARHRLQQLGLPPGDLFHVRGADYMKSKTKVPAGDWLLQPLAFEFLQASSPISHFMSHPQCRVRAALDAATTTDASQPQHAPFVWVLNFQLGQKTHHSMVLYFASFSTPPPGSLMQKFLDGDDAYRTSTSRSPPLPEAPRLVQMVVGERWPVCLLAKVVMQLHQGEELH
ncbi:hypothetical protein L7F22_012271 [Adiantum nelumboides]|nr:hypothetical protein [Adiantum nelumboides]